ncbi:MAG: MmcQ/YjbR family DNA-binding protein [Saprospiraceae bacterium]|nr:MmcQ/YjbR family DNA-binding protein [Candidatus Defluviibacterium haderslevense]
MDKDVIKHIALSFPQTSEQSHFDKPSFRIGKKIFATHNLKENRICVKLSEIDQNVFSSFDPTVIYPVPNKWGKQGWTLVNLETISNELLYDSLLAAYCEVAPKKISDAFIKTLGDR